MLFSDHGPRASTEVTFTPGGHEPQTELEQCPSELIGNFYWDRQGKEHQMNNERKSSKAGERAAEGLREATAKEEAKNESKTGALIASKNALKAPMEKAHKKNRKGELYSRPGAAFPCKNLPCRTGPIVD
jgi:hypothetical protein